MALCSKSSRQETRGPVTMTERELAKRIRDRIGAIPITASVRSRDIMSAELLDRIAETAAREAVAQLSNG